MALGFWECLRLSNRTFDTLLFPCVSVCREEGGSQVLISRLQLHLNQLITRDKVQ